MPVRHRWVHVANDTSRNPVLTFSEDVTGIMPTSAPVRDAAGMDVPGTWACTDQDEAPVRCANGAFRHAMLPPHRTVATTGRWFSTRKGRSESPTSPATRSAYTV